MLKPYHVTCSSLSLCLSHALSMHANAQRGPDVLSYVDFHYFF